MCTPKNYATVCFVIMLLMAAVSGGGTQEAYCADNKTEATATKDASDSAKPSLHKVTSGPLKIEIALDGRWEPATSLLHLPLGNR